jgi:hypothetical protein
MELYAPCRLLIRTHKKRTAKRLWLEGLMKRKLVFIESWSEFNTPPVGGYTDAEAACGYGYMGCSESKSLGTHFLEV